MGDREPRRFVSRDVRADNPNLSPEANRLLTDELREAVGADRVEVPGDGAERAAALRTSTPALRESAAVCISYHSRGGPPRVRR
jgi:hypothetical protein